MLSEQHAQITALTSQVRDLQSEVAALSEKKEENTLLKLEKSITMDDTNLSQEDKETLKKYHSDKQFQSIIRKLELSICASAINNKDTLEIAEKRGGVTALRSLLKLISEHPETKTREPEEPTT